MKGMGIFAGLLGLASLGCQAHPEKTEAAMPAVESPPEALPPAAAGQPSSPEELKEAILRDLQRAGPAEAYKALHAFTASFLQSGHATRGSLIFEGARPVTLFQFNGGMTHMNAVKELGRMLSSAAGSELHALYRSFDFGDVEALRTALADPLGVLNEDTLRASTDLRPHADFFAAYVAYEDLRAAEPSPSAALEIVARLERAGEIFAGTDQSKPLFLTFLVGAEALEQAGLRDEAIEKWKAAAESSYWPEARQDVRAAIGARIASYRERMKREVEAEVAQARREEIRALEAAHQQRHAESLQRVQALEQDLAKALEEARATRETALVEKAALLERELDRTFELARLDRTSTVLERIGDLEGIVQGAIRLLQPGAPSAGSVEASARSVDPLAPSSNFPAGVAEWRVRLDEFNSALSVVSNAVNIWQAFSGGRGRS